MVDLISKNFFFLDSNNLDDVKTHFYGCCYYKGVLYNSNAEDIDKIPDEAVDGAFVQVVSDFDIISIRQDFNGCFGIYYYDNDGYFAISNSFWYLVDNIKKKCALHINRDYLNSLVIFDICSHSVTETLVKEIKLLPRNYEFKINRLAKNLTPIMLESSEDTVPLDSKEGMQILDDWFFKYTGLIRSLKSVTNNISVDLSGGMDSRITTLLFLAANIDMNEVRVNSANNNLHGHDEDYAIASDIANKFEFSLNKGKFSIKRKPLTLRETIDMSFYTKLGFHKQMYWNHYYNETPEYHFTGQGGETRRGYWNMARSVWMKNQLAPANYYASDELLVSTSKVLTDTLEALNDMSSYHGMKDEEFPERVYRDSRTRNHYGKESVEAFLSNHLKIMPLLDSKLRMLDISKYEDKTVLFLTIMRRYCPDLAYFPVEGGRDFKKETIEEAKRISEQYPFVNENFLRKKITRKFSGENTGGTPRVVNNNPDTYCLELFKNDKFRRKFQYKFSREIYEKAFSFYKHEQYFPLTQIYAVIAFNKIILDIEMDSKEEGKSMVDKFDLLMHGNEGSSNDYNRKLLLNALGLLSCARIDIKNHGGNDNNVIISTDDPNCNHFEPKWYSKGGIGHQLESKKGELSVDLKCVGDGELKISLRGVDRKSANEPLPIYIDFSGVMFDGKELVENVITWHDEPYVHSVHCKNGDTHNLKISWQMHGYERADFMYLLMRLIK